MKVLAEIEIDDCVSEEYSFDDLKRDKYLLLHSNTKGCNVANVKIIAKEDDFIDIADSMRRALGGNPCLLDDHTDNTYHFSDPDLIRAFMAAKTKDNV